MCSTNFLGCFFKETLLLSFFSDFFSFFWYQRRHIAELKITPHFLLFWRYLSSGNINYSVKPLSTYQEIQNSGWYFRTNFMAQCKLIKLHCYSGFIAIASFFCKKNYLLLPYIVVLQTIFNFLCKVFASLFAKTDFKISSQLLQISSTSQYAISYLVTYAWCFICPPIPQEPFLIAECSVQVSCKLQLLYSILHLFLYKFLSWKWFVLLDVHGKAFSFSQGSTIHIVNNKCIKKMTLNKKGRSLWIMCKWPSQFPSLSGATISSKISVSVRSLS